MSCKYVIGSVPEVAWVAAAWREAAPGLEIVELALEGDDAAANAAAIGAALAGCGADDSAFVVCGNGRLNMQRLELMGMVKTRGIAMPPLLCRGAIVSASAAVSENCYVGAGAVIGPACRIGYNSVIGAGVLVGSGSSIGQSCYIDDGAQVGRGAAIAAHVSIGMGVIIGHGASVGKFSIVDKPGCYGSDIAAKTFIHASHARPIVVVGK